MLCELPHLDREEEIAQVIHAVILYGYRCCAHILNTMSPLLDDLPLEIFLIKCLYVNRIMIFNQQPRQMATIIQDGDSLYKLFVFVDYFN